MIVEPARGSRVLVQASGNIALNLEQHHPEGLLTQWFRRSRPWIVLLLLAGGTGVVLQHLRAAEDSLRQAEQRLAERVASLDSALTRVASSDSQQAEQATRLSARIDALQGAVDMVPVALARTVKRESATVLAALSDLRLRPAFPLAPEPAAASPSITRTAPAETGALGSKASRAPLRRAGRSRTAWPRARTMLPRPRAVVQAGM